MNKSTINDTANDSQTYWINIFNLVNTTVSQYGLGLIWFMGNIGSVFTCIIFFQPAFHNSPCVMYFIASVLSQFFTFNFALLTRMLQFGYNIQTINTALWYCKIRFYLYYICVAIPRYNIILASIDRYFASSRSALRRQWSSQKIAFRLIIGNAIFWSLIYTQVIIFYRIENGQCTPQTGTYGTFFSFYITIDSGILPIFLMLMFGLLTIRNVNRTKKRIRPIPGINYGQSTYASRISKKDIQLYRMLAHQIGIFIILNILNPCYLLYRSFTINIFKSSVQRTIESFISNMTYALVYLGFSLTFVIFFISSKMFRRECRQFIRIKILRQPITRTTSRGTAAKIILEGNAR